MLFRQVLDSEKIYSVLRNPENIAVRSENSLDLVSSSITNPE
jgi:hypothetical protein